MFKMYKAKFSTEQVTVESMQPDYADIDNETTELIVQSLKNVNGIEVAVAEWSYSPDGYSILGHNEDDDTPLKELIWAFEQAGGIYCEDRERFDKDWSNDEYEPEGSLHLNKEWFEIISFIKEVE